MRSLGAKGYFVNMVVILDWLILYQVPKYLIPLQCAASGNSFNPNVNGTCFLHISQWLSSFFMCTCLDNDVNSFCWFHRVHHLVVKIYFCFQTANWYFWWVYESSFRMHPVYNRCLRRKCTGSWRCYTVYDVCFCFADDTKCNETIGVA